jgi:hypothetical protein
MVVNKYPASLPVPSATPTKSSPRVGDSLIRSSARIRPRQQNFLSPSQISPVNLRHFHEEFPTDKLVWRGRDRRRLGNLKPPEDIPLDSADTLSTGPADSLRQLRSPSPTPNTTEFGNGSPRGIAAQSTRRSPSPERDDHEDIAFPKLTLLNTTTKPTMDDLNRLSNEQLASVENFTIVHEQHGKCVWPGNTDVRGLDLDQLVVFQAGSIGVYPDPQSKPAIGIGLNKRSIVTLNNCFPKKKKRGGTASYVTKLKKQLEKLPAATFRGYDDETGQWTFETEHWE